MKTSKPLVERPVRETGVAAHERLAVGGDTQGPADGVDERLHDAIIASVRGQRRTSTLRLRWMSQGETTRKGITPPKGRPTKGRNEMAARKRVFGPTAQWIGFAFLLALVFVTVIVLLDGGDFNVFDGGQGGG